MKTLIFITSIFFLSIQTLSAQNFWQPTNGPFGGDIRTLAINSSGHIFAGSDYAGTYRTTNNGLYWTQINNGLPMTYARGLVINSDDIIFMD
ncbi:MAG: hypothetical protein U5J96_02450 [Ignavibacteriaceae bacterium]|nr:hypothetical protein [Ignavibacteriaceae bacterium]